MAFISYFKTAVLLDPLKWSQVIFVSDKVVVAGNTTKYVNDKIQEHLPYV